MTHKEYEWTACETPIICGDATSIVPIYEVERDIRRLGDNVTIFLPMEDVMRCETAQDFKCLLSNRVTPVLNDLLEKWMEMKGR